MSKPANQALDYKDWDGYCHKLSWTFQRLVYKRSGLRMTPEEALSEVQLRWCMARATFKPELGFAFSTYFTRAVLNSVNEYLAGHKDERNNPYPLALDASLDIGDDQGSLGHDLIADYSLRSADQVLSERSVLDRIEQRTPLLARLLVLTETAPLELRQELEAARAQLAYADSISASVHSDAIPAALTPKLLARIFGFNWKHLQRLKLEIEEAAKHV